MSKLTYLFIFSCAILAASSEFKCKPRILATTEAPNPKTAEATQISAIWFLTTTLFTSRDFRNQITLIKLEHSDGDLLYDDARMLRGQRRLVIQTRGFTQHNETRELILVKINRHFDYHGDDYKATFGAIENGDLYVLSFIKKTLNLRRFKCEARNLRRINTGLYEIADSAQCSVIDGAAVYADSNWKIVGVVIELKPDDQRCVLHVKPISPYLDMFVRYKDNNLEKDLVLHRVVRGDNPETDYDYGVSSSSNVSTTFINRDEEYDVPFQWDYFELEVSFKDVNLTDKEYYGRAQAHSDHVILALVTSLALVVWRAI